MKKIGEGYYYKVYDLGNGRVFKTLTSQFSRVRKLIAWGRVENMGLWDVLNPFADKKRVQESITNSREVFHVLPKELLGNPIFKNDIEYTQDKAVILLDYFKNHSTEESLKMFEKYFIFLQTLWAYGHSDTVYNFTINCGVSEITQDFVCIDFNEFTKKKEKISSDIAKKKWLTQMSLRDFPPELSNLKEQIVKRFDQEMTQEKLDEIWGSKMSHE